MHSQAITPTALCRQCGINPPSRPGRPFCSKACSNSARRIPESERFWANVDKRGPDECWPWTAARDRDGYGLFTRDDRHQIGAHRYALIQRDGPLEAVTKACHTCDNPPCCNQAHLFPGTTQDNQHDAAQKGRKTHGELHYHSKITAALAIKIRERYAAGGVSQQQLAHEVGVSQPAVSAVIRGETWRHAV